MNKDQYTINSCIIKTEQFASNNWEYCVYYPHTQHANNKGCHQNWMLLNTLRQRQDGRHFADNIFTCIFFNENCCILIKFSLKYVRKGPIDNNPALVQIMVWRRPGDKPLSEPMMVSLLTHICVTRPQWVNNAVHFKIEQWADKYLRFNIKIPSYQ